MIFTVIYDMEISGDIWLSRASQLQSNNTESILNDWVQSEHFYYSGFKEGDRRTFYTEEKFNDPVTPIKSCKNVWRSGVYINKKYVSLTIFASLNSKKFLLNNEIILYSYLSNVQDSSYISQYKAESVEIADKMWLEDDYSWYTDLEKVEFQKRKRELWAPKIKFEPIKETHGVAVSKISNENAEGLCYRIATLC